MFSCVIILLFHYMQVIVKSISLLTPADALKLLKFFVLSIQSRYESFGSIFLLEYIVQWCAGVCNIN
jgi:hypothetical protein